MKFINPFSLVIGGVKLVDHNINSYLEYISNSLLFENNEKGKLSEDQNLLNNDVFLKLKKDIVNNSKTYLHKLDHNFQNLQICNSWASVLNKGDKVPSHTHSNSYVSGIFYLTSGSKISFTDPLSNLWTFKHLKYKNQYHISPEAGLLILFPSFLLHEVSSVDSNRISIAFNIIPKGEFGWKTAKLHL